MFQEVGIGLTKMGLKEKHIMNRQHFRKQVTKRDSGRKISKILHGRKVTKRDRGRKILHGRTEEEVSKGKQNGET